MSAIALIVLIILFFVTSVVGVVTGSNSLITVPVMFQFDIPEKEAVATNMFGLVFMSIGASIPFVRAHAIDLRATMPLVILTVISSAVGALLVGLITNEALRVIVSLGMIVVVLFTLVRGNGATKSEPHASAGGRMNVLNQHNFHTAKSPLSRRFTGIFLVGYFFTFLLGIYGGLYSGGYVTLLTPVFVAFLGMGFGEAIATTKFVNVFSSAVATIVFMWQGLVDYKLGALLGVTMFAGAYLGAH